jgi:hypothetical protein
MLSSPAEVLNEQQLDVLLELDKFAKADSPHRVFGLFGYAGTGKSTVLSFFGQAASARKHSIVFAAPTHKAVSVLQHMADPEVIAPQHNNFQTVAKLLNMKAVVDEEGHRQFRPVVDRWTDARISKYDMVIIDECSMINKDVYQWLMEAQEALGFRIIFVGDPLQLPPVREENLNNGRSLAFDVEKQVTLTQVERFSGDIAKVVSQVRRCIGEGVAPVFKNSETTIRHGGSSSFLHAYLEYADTGQIIAYRNEMVVNANNWVRKKIFGENAPAFVPGERIVAADTTLHWHVHQEFKVSDAERVKHDKTGLMCWRLKFEGSFMEVYTMDKEQKPALKARLDAIKADINTIKTNNPKASVAAKWDEFYTLKDLYPEFRPGYAQTIHASQGSTYKQVFVMERDISRIKRDKDFYGKMLYVAYSRASQMVHVL